MLSPRKSFIVQIDSESCPAAGQLRGRVENVVTGVAREFHNLTDLLEILAGERFSEAATPAAAAPQRRLG